MEMVLERLMEISRDAAIMIAAVFLIRLCFRRMPKRFLCVLWCLVGARLLLPVTIESSFGLLPSRDKGSILTESGTSFDWDGEFLNQMEYGENGITSDSPESLPEENESFFGTDLKAVHSAVKYVLVVWLVGIVVCLSYLFSSTIVLRQKLSDAVWERENIYRSDRIGTPFVFGVFRPRIYLPYSLWKMDEKYVILHEGTHIRYGEHIIKPVFFLLCCIYWFHPLVWAAYFCLCRDMESACDERVIRELGENERQAYAKALLGVAVGTEKLPACPVAFGEENVKSRVKDVLNYRKPEFWIVLLSVLLVVIFAIVMLPNRKSPDETAVNQAIQSTEEKETEGNTEENERAGSEGAEVRSWSADLTHDGVDERIEVDLNGVSQATTTGEEETVRVYSGKTGNDKPIWTAHADTVHPGWNGIYIYKNPEDGLSYLFIWKPTMYQGVATYQYRIFFLTEEGKEQVLEEGSIEFDLNNVQEGDAKRVENYLERVNEILRNSFVLVDTDNGEIFFSETGKPVTREFDAEAIVDEIRSGNGE